MRRNAMFVGGLVVLSCTFSALLWREFQDGNYVSSTLSTRLTQDEEKPIAQLPPAVSVEGTVSLSDRPSSTASDSAVTRDPWGFQDKSVADRQAMLKDEEYRQARLAEIRARIPGIYPGVAEELLLSEEEASRLIDLLAEHQLDRSRYTVRLTNDPETDRSLINEAAKEGQLLDLKREADIRTQLGESGYAQWKAYQTQRMGRVMAYNYGQTLESVGLPLSRDQARVFTDMAIAEEMRRIEEATSIADRQPQYQTQKQMAENRVRRQVDSDRRLLAAASGDLTSQQIEAIQTSMEERIRRAESRLGQERSN